MMFYFLNGKSTTPLRNVQAITEFHAVIQGGALQYLDPDPIPR